MGAAVGLTPRKYASGEVDYDGHITKCGDAFLRSHLFEAAKVMLSRAGKPNALKAWGLRLAKRSSKKNACVAVARRLAVTMHAMWRDGTVFEMTDAAVAATGADLETYTKQEQVVRYSSPQGAAVRQDGKGQRRERGPASRRRYQLLLRP